MADYPFNPDELNENSRKYSDDKRYQQHNEEGIQYAKDRQLIDAAIQAHVLGRRVVGVEFVRNLNEQGDESTQLTEYAEVAIYLDNNVIYVARVVVPLLKILSRGEALAHTQPESPFYQAQPGPEPQVG